ncbi:MAG TPA: DUF4476 domain-containing protein [Flavobacteriales bacterium]|nr:DUF4476 domain-containing protein [Flavobacteriales bacterium]
MKNIYQIIFIALFGINTAVAQSSSNIVIFSEDGEPFFAFVNGVKQNTTAETNVKISGVTSESFNFRIVFANPGNDPISKNQYLAFGSEYTFKIKRDKKGKMVMRLFGQVELAQSVSNPNTIAYHATELPSNSTNTTQNSSGSTWSNDQNNNGNSSTVVNGGSSSTTTTETVQTTTTITNGNGANGNINVNTSANGSSGSTANNENVNFNMNVGGNGLNVDVSVSGNANGTQGMGTENTNINMGIGGEGTNNNISTTTTTTTTTTSSSSSVNGNANWNTNTTADPNYSSYNTNTTYQSNTYSGSCSFPADDVSFDKIKSSIESKPFEDTKMSTAKLATKNTCLSTAQVTEIAKMFMMDEQRLEFAKYAWDYTTDRQNFYQVSEAFSFDSTTTELNKFLETK